MEDGEEQVLCGKVYVFSKYWCCDYSMTNLAFDYSFSNLHGDNVSN